MQVGVCSIIVNHKYFSEPHADLIAGGSGWDIPKTIICLLHATSGVILIPVSRKTQREDTCSGLIATNIKKS